MHYFRNLHKKYLLISLISIGLAGRALVASGFMLNTDLNNDDLFTITLCHGSNSINQSSVLANSDNNNAPENDDEQNYCNLWTSSATSLVLVNSIIINEEYYPSNQLSNYDNFLIVSPIKISKFVRAPPVVI